MPAPLAAAPRLETERLILRGYRLSDYEQLHANWNDQLVYNFTSGRPSTREESWNRMMRYFGHWPALGYGFWALEIKQSGQFIGEIGMADFHRGIPEVPNGFPEFGWVLASSAHGKGYATEALKVTIDWADQNVDASSHYCIIDPKNLASQKLARKFGFKLIAEALYHDAPSLVLQRNLRSFEN